MKDLNKLPVIMVGVGGFGAHRRNLMRETGLYDIVGAYDFNKEALENCEKEDGAKPAGSFEELLSNPEAEALIISTGAKYHTEQAVTAMERGLHVFVEKPLCSTREELMRLVEVQKRTDRVFVVGHHDHSGEHFSRGLKKLIDNGELGTIAAFEKTTCHNGGLLIKPGDWRGDPDKNPGGMLFQCGIHGIHELMFYFGPVKSVSSLMRYDVHTTATADAAVCMLEFESGIIGTLNAYHVSSYRHTLNIYGTKKNIYINNRFFNEGTLAWVQNANLENKKEPMNPISFEGEDDPYGSLKSFYRAIRMGEAPYPSLREGARAVAVVFAAEESARTGKKVEVEY